VATTERGAWTGNRGVIHNEHKEIVRNFAVKYWITCVLEYKDNRRAVMSPNRWTELFFLDEATAFAAGHRPCGFCRYEDFKRFKRLWLAANSAGYGLVGNVKMDVIDTLIHQERLDEKGHQRMFQSDLHSLPSGTFITFNDLVNAYLWHNQRLFKWSFKGYSEVLGIELPKEVLVITPFSYVQVFKAGYVPQIHDSMKV
jgi:hypothetical protein